MPLSGYPIQLISTVRRTLCFVLLGLAWTMIVHLYNIVRTHQFKWGKTMPRILVWGKGSWHEPNAVISSSYNRPAFIQTKEENTALYVPEIEHASRLAIIQNISGGVWIINEPIIIMIIMFMHFWCVKMDQITICVCVFSIQLVNIVPLCRGVSTFQLLRSLLMRTFTYAIMILVKRQLTCFSSSSS